MGPNGCGKSSALQAIYGCPKDSNTGDFWFSTDVDPISEGGDEGVNRFIYKYHVDELGRSVEVLNTRAKRIASSSRRENLDYWETSKPLVRDSMEKMNSNVDPREAPFRSKTRWNPVVKNVIYIDFRSELSAFDKCFNFGTFSEGETIASIRDFIRYRSRPLKHAIESGSGYRWHSKNCSRNEFLPGDQLSWVCRILGKAYKSAQVVRHNYFDCIGDSIIFSDGDNKYSEAVAGSGEVAIVASVNRIMSSPPGSLILLDEPEVSLHPGAQAAFREFLYSEIVRQKHQVVICTHSPSMIEGLPDGAIKLFLQDSSGRYSIQNQTRPDQAFIRIGALKGSEYVIYVEDSLSKIIIEKALVFLGGDLDSLYSIVVYPGGGDKIKQDLVVNFFISSDVKSFVLLDGDQRRHSDDDLSLAMGIGDVTELKSLVASKIVGGIKYPFDTNMSDEDKVKVYKGLIKTYRERFYFGVTNVPEELIWRAARLSEDLSGFDSIDCFKERFRAYADGKLGQSTSSDIFTYQKQFLNSVDFSHDLWVSMLDVVRKILSNR